MGNNIHLIIKSCITIVTVTVVGFWFSNQVTEAANHEAVGIIMDDYQIIRSAIYNYQNDQNIACPSISDLQGAELIKGPEDRINGLSQTLINYSIKNDENLCFVSMPTPTKKEAMKELELSILAFVPAFIYNQVDRCNKLIMGYPFPGDCDSSGRFTFTVQKYLKRGNGGPSMPPVPPLHK